jgi:hypothetical protein
MTDSLTILRAHRRRLAKTIRPNGDIEGYDQVRTVDLIEVPIGGLDDLLRRLRQLERRPDCAVVRGAIADPARTKGVRRLLYQDGDDAPSLREAPRRWVALDFDDLPRPDWMDPQDLLGCAVVAIDTLPSEFSGARAIVQATSSHGLKPGIRLRAWFWLGRAVDGAALKWYLRSAPVDRAVLGVAQLIYTAAPVFLPGAFDPLRDRIDVVPGAEAVAVPPEASLKPPPRPRPIYRLRADGDRAAREIAGLVRTVAHAADGNRNSILYWASRVMAEKVEQRLIDSVTASNLLADAALQAGLAANEAAATVRSGLRHGGA